MCLQDVASSSDFKDYYVGVLDFPGFAESESEGSSLSRLLMNYASERFQKFYNEKIFTAEMEKYKQEKLKYQKIEFNNNDTVVKLMDSQQRPEGLFSQLEALASRSTGASAAQEAAFLTKLETIQLQRNVVEVRCGVRSVRSVRSVREYRMRSIEPPTHKLKHKTQNTKTQTGTQSGERRETVL